MLHRIRYCTRFSFESSPVHLLTSLRYGLEEAAIGEISIGESLSNAVDRLVDESRIIGKPLTFIGHWSANGRGGVAKY